MSNESEVLTRRDGMVLYITLNRPHRRNALTKGVCVELRKVFDSLRDDRALRCIVMTGAGDKAYCAGGDLKPGDSPFAIDFDDINTEYADLMRAAKACVIPIVGRINGACMAGGMGLLAMCDLSVAAEDAKFALPEVKIGLFPLQVAVWLRTILSERNLADLCLTGRAIGAVEAKEMGLINRIASRAELDAAVDEYVSAILAAAPVAVRRGKYAFAQMSGMSFNQAMALAESMIGPMALTNDAKEGLGAFNEGRKPVWPVRGK
jgi:methylglutaconyl-CoA hydratase